jgi:hypothetical protein
MSNKHTPAADADWMVREGFPEIDPVVDAADADTDERPWHHVKSSARMASIVDGTTLVSVCGARLGVERPIVWRDHSPAGTATRRRCPRCSTARGRRAS